MKKKFDKYEYEDIRTDYLEFSSDNNQLAPAGLLESRTVVEFDTSNHRLKVAETPIDDMNKNETVFVLAEDCKPGDLGMVYYVIEHVANLI